MKKFSVYGVDDCYFTVSKYDSGYTRLQIFSDTIGPVCSVTHDPAGYKMSIHPTERVDVPIDSILVKNYSENYGIDTVLKNMSILTDQIGVVHSGFVYIPVYNYDQSVLDQYMK